MCNLIYNTNKGYITHFLNNINKQVEFQYSHPEKGSSCVPLGSMTVFPPGLPTHFRN